MFLIDIVITYFKFIKYKLDEFELDFMYGMV